jgi:WD40 repeat protein
VSILYDQDDRLPLFGHWIAKDKILLSDGHGGCHIVALPTLRKIATLPITNISAVWPDKFQRRIAMLSESKLIIIKTVPELHYTSHDLPPGFNRQWAFFFGSAGYLYAAGNDSTLYQYSSHRGWCLLGECKLRDPSVGIEWSHGRCILGSTHGEIEIFQTSPFKSIFFSQEHADRVQDVNVLDAKRFITVSRDRRISSWVWAKTTLKEAWSIPEAHVHFINCAVMVDTHLWTGSSDGVISVRPLRDRAVLWEQRIHDDAIRFLAVSPERRYVLTTSDDGLHKVISTRHTPTVRHSLGSRRAYIISADTILQGETTLFAAGKSDGEVLFGRIIGGGKLSITKRKVFSSPIRAIKFRSLNTAVCGLDSGSLAMIHKSGSKRFTVSSRKGAVYSLALNKDGKNVWVGRRNGSIERRELPSLKLLSTNIVHTSIVGDIVKGKGNELITCSDDQTIALVRADSTEILRRIALHSSAVNNLVYFEDIEDRHVLLATSDDCAAYLIDMETSELIAKYTAHTAPVRSACNMGNGQIATGDRAGWVHIWRLERRETLYRECFGSRITRLVFEASNCSLLVFTERHIIRLKYKMDTDKLFTIKRRQRMTRHFNLLHLSDLHFGTDHDAKTWHSQLAEDLRNDLNCTHLDCIIVSGDITNSAATREYNSALKFFELISDEFGLNRKDILVVPGNHDVNWKQSKRAYSAQRRKDYHGSMDEAHIIDKKEYVEVRADTEYRTRFTNFSEFLEKLVGEPYSMEYEKQYIVGKIADGRILLMGYNSAWQTDHHYRDRAGIHPVAVANTLSELRKASRYKALLKIAVWHHPIHYGDDSRIKDVGYLEQLSKAGFKIGLHGHIHKSANQTFKYDVVPGGRKMECVAAGTFGAPTRDWSPGYPLQYNFLRIDLDRNIVTVETRRREEVNGAWKPDARWTRGKGKDPEPRYVIEF